MSPVAAPERVHRPDLEHFEQAYRAYAPLVYRTAWGVLGSREDAEDVLQTVFLKLLRREYPPDLKGNPQAYLYRAAVTVSLDCLKARRRRPVLVEHPEGVDAAAFHPRARFDDDTHHRLFEAIAQLTAEAAEVVLLRYMQGRSVVEIAKALGVSRTVVAVRLFRARARLKTLLRPPAGRS
jgi:RNA polymerase sigma-70 factor (ECF subfamily)